MPDTSNCHSLENFPNSLKINYKIDQAVLQERQQC